MRKEELFSVSFGMVHKSPRSVFTRHFTNRIMYIAGRLATNTSPRQKVAGKPVEGPSAIGARYGGTLIGLGVKNKENGDQPQKEYYSVPVEIRDPKEIVAQYANAARLAKEAGFDGVEIHAANGYLVPQVSKQLLEVCMYNG